MPWLPWKRKNVSRQPATIDSAAADTSKQIYLLPTSDVDMNRLDFQHFIFRQVLQSNFVAPIHNPREILDVGCGTGRWVLEMSRDFPQANVFGIDISPVMPQPIPLSDQSIGIPVNCSFLQGNILSEQLPFADASFDFVHMRLLFLAIPSPDWPKVIRELLRVTRPGGWIELLEGGPPILTGPYINKLVHFVQVVSAQRGIDLTIGEKLPFIVKDAGLINIHEQQVDIPVGTYGGRIGIMMETDTISGYQKIGQLIVKSGMMTESEMTNMLLQIPNEFDTYHTSHPHVLVYGQRGK